MFSCSLKQIYSARVHCLLYFFLALLCNYFVVVVLTVVNCLVFCSAKNSLCHSKCSKCCKYSNGMQFSKWFASDLQVIGFGCALTRRFSHFPLSVCSYDFHAWKFRKFLRLCLQWLTRETSADIGWFVESNLSKKQKKQKNTKNTKCIITYVHMYNYIYCILIYVFSVVCACVLDRSVH